MRILRYWIPFFFVASLIVYLSSIPADEFPSIDFPHLDKIVHFCLYFLLAFTLCRATTADSRLELSWDIYKGRFLLGILFTLAFGITDEWHQSFVHGRNVDPWDIVADVLGGIAGAHALLLYRKLIQKFYHPQRGQVS